MFTLSLTTELMRCSNVKVPAIDKHRHKVTVICSCGKTTTFLTYDGMVKTETPSQYLSRHGWKESNEILECSICSHFKLPTEMPDEFSLPKSEKPFNLKVLISPLLYFLLAIIIVCLMSITQLSLFPLLITSTVVVLLCLVSAKELFDIIKQFFNKP